MKQSRNFKQQLKNKKKTCKECKSNYLAVKGFGCFKGHKKTDEQLQDNSIAESCVDFRSNEEEKK